MGVKRKMFSLHPFVVWCKHQAGRDVSSRILMDLVYPHVVLGLEVCLVGFGTGSDISLLLTWWVGMIDPPFLVIIAGRE